MHDLIRLCVGLLFLFIPLTGFAAEPETAPSLPDGSTEASRAIAGFKVPAGTEVQLFAAEPQVGNPVAICLDERNRVFVAEQYRFNRGTEENRTRPFLLDDDLQIRTLDDRLAMFQKFATKFDGGMNWFSRYTDQVRLLEDRDADGRADRSTVFATGFNDPLDGLAAGVIARDGNVYLTCIPHLWLLRDDDGDGRAEVRKSLHRGFGVNAAFLGHDLHGLTWGPDGKLYFSVGDRGFHVRTQEGATLSGPRSGAVFRCNADGSQLEVVARGLRNPQELAFDQYGNLFAADNNCDKGDHSRLVWVVEGGESGWNMAYQSLAAPYLTGPWHAEKIWHLATSEQPAWIVPPVGKLGAGPAGFTYYPGVGLSARYQDHFFMCNYTGNGGIESFAVRQKGAGFEIVDDHDFWKPIQATDVDFGYDGKMYVSDYVKLEWNGGGGWGRIYTLRDREQGASPEVRRLTQLFHDGFTQRPTTELFDLLAHADLRVRQRAQFELARRATTNPPDQAAGDALLAALRSEARPLVRLHGLWGLGQIAAARPEVVESITARLSDPNDHVRAQAAKVLGDIGAVNAASQLVALLTDPNPRVQFHAVMSLGKLKAEAAFEAIVELLRRNKDADPFLRHAAVMALVQCASTDQLKKLSSDPDPAVRMAVVLVLRRRADPRLADFLLDAEPRIVLEAARAINDVPLDDATPALAQLAQRFRGAPETIPEPLLRRVINANFRLGQREHAESLVVLAAHDKLSLALRGEALAALRDWESPPPRDRVTGFWRPLAPRSRAIAKEAIQQNVSQLLAGANGDLQARAAELIAVFEIPVNDELFFGWVSESDRPTESRIAALRLLAGRKATQLPTAIDVALRGEVPRLRATARDILASTDPERTLPLLTAVLDDGQAHVEERQAALATVANLRHARADELLERWVGQLVVGAVPAELQLDVVEAAVARKSERLAQPLANWSKLEQQRGPTGPFRVALNGGNADRGRMLFEGHPAAQCIRCHRVGNQGGTAGPELTKVAQREQREHFLQSLVDPDAKIAPGFGTVTLVLDDGRIVTGIIKKEEETSLVVELVNGGVATIKKSEIEERSPARSPMPSATKALSRRELRDLVEYLATLK